MAIAIIIILLIVVVGALAIFVKARPDTDSVTVKGQEREEVEDVIALNMAEAKRKKEEKRIAKEAEFPDTGELTNNGDGTWLLNPKSYFPLNVRIADEKVAKELKETLDRGYFQSFSEAARSVHTIIKTHSITCKEVEEYLRVYKPVYMSRINNIKLDSASFAGGAGNLNKTLDEAGKRVLKDLKIQPHCNLITLFEGHHSDAPDTEAVKKKFGSQAADFYSSKKKGIHTVPQNHPQRSAFEKLVSLKLAHSGSRTNSKKILQTLSLKDMSKLVEDLNYPDFKDRKEAYKTISQLPDLKIRLNHVIDYRTIYEVLPLSDDLSPDGPSNVKMKAKYVQEVAKLITGSYLRGGSALADHDGYKKSSYALIKGWELVPEKDCCQYCKEQAAKKYDKKSYPRTPMHLGCRCKVITIL